MLYKDEDFQKAREQFRKLTAGDLQKAIGEFKKLTPKEYERVLAAIYKAGDNCNFSNVEQVLEFFEENERSTENMTRLF